MNKGVCCIPFKDIPNSYIVISAREADTGNGVEKCMSFFYDGGEIGAEWEPNHGPITVIYQCQKTDKDAQGHWFYDYCTGYGNWSQLAVEEEGLPAAFLGGHYQDIFEILKDWANR